MAGPLMSWDIFSEGHYRRLRRLEDWQNLKRLAQRQSWLVEWDLEKLIAREGKVALVTDPSLTIQFATASLVEMTGYFPEEVRGRRPSLFQGEKTSATAKAQIRAAIHQLKPFKVTLLNYRKNGSTYACEVEGYPVFTRKKVHSHFIAFEQEDINWKND